MGCSTVQASLTQTEGAPSPSERRRSRPEKNHAANFDNAIPMLARNAAMIARLPPDALMRAILCPPRDRAETDQSAERRMIVSVAGSDVGG